MDPNTSDLVRYGSIWLVLDAVCGALFLICYGGGSVDQRRYD